MELGMSIIREKKHRLSPALYRGIIIVGFTACLKHRTPFFVTKERSESIEQILLTVLEHHSCSAEVYLFMPDHVHLLLRGTSETADVLKAMYEFKQRSGFWLKIHYPGIRWQKDFYDHILRHEEEHEKHVRYVLDNPVRAGLCTNWNLYPFKGSTVYDF